MARGPVVGVEERGRIARLFLAGLSWDEIARKTGRSRATVDRAIAECGGIATRDTTVRAGDLQFEEREEISRGLAAGHSFTGIAKVLGRAPSTVSREVNRNGGRDDYRATRAQARAANKAKRPKTSKLAVNLELAREVTDRLELRWSPEQISRDLRLTFPDRPEMWVSHETIYKALFVQGRGELRKELTRCLRTGRARRRPRTQTRGAGGPGRIKDMINISERPAEAADRAVPGHWEGDLIVGADGQSAIATLVERSTRFVMMAALPDGRAAEAVTAALIDRVNQLPEQLWRSLTWDQGKELAHHAEFTIATGIDVYFCDPHSPWQRGSNENTNGLLRQYLPKGTDLSQHTQDDLDAIAAELNGRPRQTLGWMKPSGKLNELIVATTA